MAPQTIIIGGGIIGLSTAFYLAEALGGNGDTITVVDNTPNLLESASGAANGGTGPSVPENMHRPMRDLNYSLLTQLKNKNGGYKEWCHRPCRTVRIVPRQESDESASEMPAWLPVNNKYKAIQQGDSFEHISPRQFCQFLIKRCQAMKVTILTSTEVIKVDMKNKEGHNTLDIVHLQPVGKPNSSFWIPCQRILISAGAWTPQVINTLFPANRLDIKLMPGPPSSPWLNVRDPRWTPSQTKKGASQTLWEEVFGFPLNMTNFSDGTIYVARLTLSQLDKLPPPPESLPRDASSADIELELMRKLRMLAATALGLDSEQDLEVIREGRAYYSLPTCRRPITAELTHHLQGSESGDGNEADGDQGSGVFVSFGHDAGCSYALGNGKVLSEIMLGQKELSCDMSDFAIPDTYIRS